MDSSERTPQESFQFQVAQCLEILSVDLVAVLRRVIGHSYPVEVSGISFEVFSDGFEDGFPVHMYLMDASDWFLDADGSGLPYSPPVSPGLLEIEAVYDGELSESLLDACPDADDMSLATGVLIPWFARCWHDAGGTSFDRRAWIQHHDSLTRFDLAKGKWYEADMGASG